WSGCKPPTASEGSPVWYHVITGLALKGFLLSISRQELLRDKFWSCELLLRECEQQSQELGKKVEKITAVFDFEGLSLRHLWKPRVEFAQEINHGGEVPKSYHLHNQARPQYEHTATVTRDSFLRVETEVLSPEVAVRIRDLPPWSQCPRWGILCECQSVNADVLMFNNTYSLVHSKHISYTTEVLLPDQSFVEKVEKSEASFATPTPSSLLFGSTISSQPSWPDPPPTSPGTGILQHLVPGPQS
ncbi:hypothetical protein HPG69_019154, partial [Diceros bicornis minor]